MFEGQLLGIIVAESPQAAQKAVNKVKVEYEDLSRILTIEVSNADVPYLIFTYLFKDMHFIY